MAFDATLTHDGDTSLIKLTGELDSATALSFRDTVAAATDSGSSRLIFLAGELTYMSSAGLRCLVFARQKMGPEKSIVFVGATDAVEQTIRLTGFDRSMVMSDYVPE
jgi:anti-anti-sigma factor